MPYKNLRGHGEFCTLVQALSFDRLANDARLYFIVKEGYNSSFRLHVHVDLVTSATVTDVFLVGYAGPQAGRRPFILSRLSKLVGNPLSFHWKTVSLFGSKFWT